MKNVFDPQSVREILNSSEFQSYPMADVFTLISSHTRLDFSPVAALCRYLPIFLEGPAHATVRKKMALLLAGARERQARAIELKLELIFAKAASCDRIDLVADLARPLWVASSCEIIDEEWLQLASEVSLLFFADESVSRRKSVSDRLAPVMAQQDESRIISFALAALGHAPFTGSIALSLYDMVAANEGRRANEIEWPKHLISSAVHSIDRVDRVAQQAQESPRAGEPRVRVHLHHSTMSGHNNPSAMFGHGPHTCLGKVVTELAWRAICRRLATFDRCLRTNGIQIAHESQTLKTPAAAHLLVSEQ